MMGCRCGGQRVTTARPTGTTVSTRWQISLPGGAMHADGKQLSHKVASAWLAEYKRRGVAATLVQVTS